MSSWDIKPECGVYLCAGCHIMKHCITIMTLLIVAQNLSAQINVHKKRVIFPKDVKIYFATPDTPYYRFTPTYENIDSADLFLNKFLINSTAKDEAQFSVDNYYRQYAGMWINGRNCVYINAFCKKPKYFLQNTYYPKGGGKCYFSAFYDLNKKEVFNFRFNASK